jgi:hypothetical protein
VAISIQVGTARVVPRHAQRPSPSPGCPLSLEPVESSGVRKVIPKPFPMSALVELVRDET